MKKYLPASAILVLSFLQFTITSAQVNLAPDQNPDFAVSRNKYIAIADSINQWHSTTVQQTYKAYDWYEQKQERRNERIRFRREIQLERARNYYPYNSYNNYGYNYRYNNQRYYNNNYNRYQRNMRFFWCF